jgi:hypothetical protein
MGRRVFQRRLVEIPKRHLQTIFLCLPKLFEK